ncbi:carbamoyl phosphate synthase large subunit [Lapidilactobacillus luobeiensis]|uniref:carbamoyl phosphate synthase large subunit n=1 Tax=Lapidilactobacillus luobeiensis TaxID=2950371 RepID=UPI0021C27AEF|nr:carbamoyl phosphate synthase large subunit [Lapidilactobacillus luobeiensis]
MGKRTDIEKILVIGSGPYVVGQSTEFDYLGTEAVNTLADAGYQVVLVNSNPATNMTDRHPNVSIYLEPITLKFLTEIIRKELPDAILATVGGQTTVNLVLALRRSGLLDQLGVKILGTDLSRETAATSVQKFQTTMQALQLPILASLIVTKTSELTAASNQLGWPIMVRPVNSIGGTGGGVAESQHQLQEIFERALALSPLHQVALCQSVVGAKEIEFEVLRDSADQVTAIFNCEQLNPVGIHSGDSITLAPIQTLTDRQVQRLRQTAIMIVRELKIVGSCNIQFAVAPDSDAYWIMKATPRLGRTSAFAAKALGYPLAKIATLLTLGLRLDQIAHPYEQGSTALVEPAFDYIACKFPGWPFDRITGADRTLGAEMKATGEVLVFERNVEAALLKGVRSFNLRIDHLWKPNIAALPDDELTAQLIHPTDEEIFCLAEALRRGYSVSDLSHISKIDAFFIAKIQNIIELENELRLHKGDSATLARAKVYGFSDLKISQLWEITVQQLRDFRKEAAIEPGFQELNSLATTPLIHSQQYFITYATENEVVCSDQREKILVIGAGPTKIEQGSEVDYETVRGLLAMRQLGYQTILLNNNPDAYSTSVGVADRLYYAPINAESALNVATVEQPKYIITQLGGKSASKLTAALQARGLKILGAQADALDQVHQPERFRQLLAKLTLKGPQIRQLLQPTAIPELVQQNDLRFPLLIHPNPEHFFSPTEVIRNLEDLQRYLGHFQRDPANFPFTLREFLSGDKYEVDGIFDGDQVLITGILAHLEHSSLHSGEAMTVTPAQNLSPEMAQQIQTVFKLVGQELNARGFMNIRFLVKEAQLYVLAIDLKGSRNLAFINKTTTEPVVALGVQVLLGASLSELGYPGDQILPSHNFHVKIPVYSFTKLNKREKLSQVQMKTTGEAIGSDLTFEKALYKALEAARQPLPAYGRILFSIASHDLTQGLAIANRFKQLGYQIVATAKTAAAFQAAGLPTDFVHNIGKKQPDIATEISSGRIQMVINTAEWRGPVSISGALLREVAVMHSVPLITTMDEAKAILTVLESRAFAIQPLS